MMSTRLLGSGMHLTHGERSLLPRTGRFNDPKVQKIVGKFTNRKRQRWQRDGYPLDLKKLRERARVRRR